MNRHGFICAGCWTVDRIKITDVWPAQEGLARIQKVERHGGGSAHNSGIDIKRMDPSMPVSTVGVIGSDDDGDYLFEQACAHKIDTKRLYRSDERSTSYTDVITVNDTGRRTFFHYTGTNDLLTPEHFNFENSTEKILHLGLLSLHRRMDTPVATGSNGWAEVFKSAKQHGIETSIELVSIQAQRLRELTCPCFPWLDYLVVNDLEIGALAERVTVTDGHTNVDACISSAKSVLAQGPMQRVVVHYPHGAFSLDQNQTLTMSNSYAIPQSQIAGTVGAGDAFAAGFLYGMHERWSAGEALELGHVIAAASLRSANTVESVSTIGNCRTYASHYDKRLPVKLH